MKRAIFGGTFDPVHQGHVEIVRAILNGGYSDIVTVLPAWEPPHKKSVRTAYCHRLEMAKLAFKEMDGVEVSDLESVWCFEPSYSWRVLNAFQELYPGDEIQMVIGGDSLKNFASWYNVRELAEKFNFLIYPRRGEDCDFAALAAAVGAESAGKMCSNIINASFFEISSTILRKKLANSENTANFISETVYNYIKDKKLYRSGIEEQHD